MHPSVLSIYTRNPCIASVLFSNEELISSSQIPGTRCFGFLLEAQMGLFQKKKGRRERKKLQCETQPLPSWRGSAELRCSAHLHAHRKCSAGISREVLI